MFRSIPPTLAALTGLLLLAGCGGNTRPDTATAGSQAARAAGSLAAARAALAKATPCCRHFSEFDFATVLPATPRRFSIGAGLPMADFNGSRSWFLAFRLPDQTKPPYEVLLKSELNGRWLHTSYLFAPTVVVLDAGFRPMHQQDVQLCEYMGWTKATSGAFGHVKIGSPAARYLVVYSSAEQMTGSTYWEQSPTAFSAEAPVKMMSTGSFQIPHGPDGALFVGLLTDRYRKSVDNAICGKPEPTKGGAISDLRRALKRNGHES